MTWHRGRRFLSFASAAWRHFYFYATNEKGFRSKAIAPLSAIKLLLGGLFYGFISALHGAQRLNCYQNGRHHSSAVHCKGEIAGRFAASAQEVAAA